MVWVFFLRKT